MPSSLLTSAAIAGGMLSQMAHAYTQVNVPQPFMRKNIDPIVFPGEYGKSHLHSFFGSDSVTINTNSSSELQDGCTNAENPNDLSVYWVPTPLSSADGGNTWEPVPLSRFSAYYNLGETPAEVPIPQNLKMVAGDAKATTKDAMVPDAKAEWMCESEATPIGENGFPTQTCSTHIQQLLYFPQCVNPTSLETAYKSRDYGTPNWCPEGMSSMPQLRFSIRWDLRDALPNGWSGEAPLKLACGNAWCSHGDFINGWTEEAAENMLDTTQEKQKFSPVNGALGQSGDTMDCEATDADPENGTSDYEESVEAMQKRSVGAWGWVSRARMMRV